MSTQTDWNTQILGMSEKELAFVMNAQALSACSPFNLRRWGFNLAACCKLCGKKAATGKHLLSSCPKALFQNRYTWRHDNVLRCISSDLCGLISRANRNKNPKSQIKHISHSFVKSGATAKPRRKEIIESLLSSANDWKMVIDFDASIPFPITDVPTNLRPDIVIYSLSLRIVIWGELTCPGEERIAESAIKKMRRYNKLAADLSLKLWKVYPMTLEVGSIGFLGNSVRHFLKSLGAKSEQLKAMLKRMSLTASRSSFYIWNAIHCVNWNPPQLYKWTPSVSFPAIVKPCFPAKPSYDLNPIAWLNNNIEVSVATEKFPKTKEQKSSEDLSRRLKKLSDEKVTKFYHFTDYCNLDSIKEHGLLSWYELDKRKLTSVCGGNETSHNLDLRDNLEDFVRLSFSPNHPMQHVCLRENRIKKVAILEIDIQVCTKEGTLFSDCNTTRKKAIISDSIENVHFDIVKKADQFSVKENDRHFFQAEVLVKNHIPAVFISFPEIKANTGNFVRKQTFEEKMALEELYRKQSEIFETDPDVNPIVEEKHNFISSEPEKVAHFVQVTNLSSERSKNGKDNTLGDIFAMFSKDHCKRVSTISKAQNVSPLEDPILDTDELSAEEEIINSGKDIFPNPPLNRSLWNACF